MIKFSIIIPAYNEEKGIDPLLKSLLQLEFETWEYEIIVVNDGSTDKTAETVKKHPVKLINHRRNKGYGAALKTGIRKAEGEYVVLVDADGQHRLEDIKKIIAKAVDYDMVVGQRVKGSFIQKNRIVGKKIIQWVSNYLAGERIPDLNSGLRSFKKEIILRYLHLLPDSFSASTTSTIIFLKRSYDIEWVPIKTVERQGKSSVRQIKHGSYVIYLILRIITLFHPLKVFFPVSIFLGVFGVIRGLIYLPNGGLSEFAGLLMLSGLIIFMFGILCDQVSQLRLEKYE
jgi:glycosyltransferase involved in cell wall biosynthesis